jgi:hypothetical protein
MSFMQLSGSWRSYLIVLAPFTLVSLMITFNLQFIYSALAWIGRRIRLMRPRVDILSHLEAGLHVGYKKTA